MNARFIIIDCRDAIDMIGQKGPPAPAMAANPGTYMLHDIGLTREAVEYAARYGRLPTRLSNQGCRHISR
jgi:hypothetical protein